MTIDEMIMRGIPLGMNDNGTYLRIEYVHGFEIFGAYESWGQGYHVSDPRLPRTVRAKTLELAIGAWYEVVKDMPRTEMLTPLPVLVPREEN